MPKPQIYIAETTVLSQLYSRFVNCLTGLTKHHYKSLEVPETNLKTNLTP